MWWQLVKLQFLTGYALPFLPWSELPDMVINCNEELQLFTTTFVRLPDLPENKRKLRSA